MITIENIKRIEKTYWNFDSKTIQCIKAEEVNDDLILNRNSYTFDFDIGLGDVPLVIWLDRHKDNEQNGYRFENNLVDATNYVDIKDLTNYNRFIVMLQDYLDSIQSEIKRNFFK
jgi:hypothetical protein